MNATESVSRESIMTGTKYCPIPVFISVATTKVKANTITVIYISAKRAFRYGFFVICKC